MSLLDTASLIVTPNGYKEGKLYSVIPSDGSGDMSVVRATTATRVNSAGLVELVPYNLLTYSQDFSNAAWTKTNTTVTSGQSGYDGSTNAWKLQATATTNCEVDQGFSESETKNFSIYAKAGNVNFVAISVFGAGFGWYNLSNGTLGSSGGTFVSRNIESVGNGWYRCSIVTNVAASGVAVYVCNADNSTATSIGSNIFIQNSQLVEGTLPKDYQNTETRLNIPRLDYSNGTCPSLLVEPQRTNLLTYSSSFDNADWTKSNVTISANSTISPSGNTDADTLTASGGSALHTIFWPTSLFGANHSISVYAKKNTNDFLQIYTDFVNTDYANFDLANGTTGTIGSTVISSSIESVGNGWYRCSFVTGSASSRYVNFSIVSSASAPRAETNSLTTSVYIWGAQLEAGAYPTSYIPTTSASVTRNADVISKTGISSLIGQTEGTLFVDLYRENLASPFIFMLANSVGSNAYLNSIYMFQQANGTIVSDGFISGTLQFSFSSSGLSVGRHKLAIAYKQNDFVWYIDGVQVATDTSGNVPTFSAFEINGADISSTSNVETNAVALWKTRLTNTQLAQLTTI
jgi:hypothetical protein